MSGDLTGEATSRSLVNSVTKQMTKGLVFIDRTNHLIMGYVQSLQIAMPIH